MDRLCRICMTMETNRKFKKLFDKKNNFAENLFYVSEIVIFEISNNLPALICHQCDVDLEIAARVKRVALETDAFLKTMSSTADIQLLSNIINNEYTEIKVKDDPDDIVGAFRGFEVDPSLIKLELADDILEYEEVSEPTFEVYDIKPNIQRQRFVSKRPQKTWHHCPVEGCEKKFPRPFRLKMHMDSHSDARNFGCEVCGNMYKNVRYLRIHMLIHTNADRRWICDLCGNTFPGKAHVRRHINAIHLEKYREVCHLCGKSLGNREMLKVHMLYTHNPTQKNFQCHICSKSFLTKSRLTQHVSGHGERPWACELCGRAFSKRYKLGEHMKQVHHSKLEEIKKFVCTLCGSSFDRNRLLQEHLRTKHDVAMDEDM